MSRRYAARKDANHNEIADGLRAIGCSVHELHAAGDGIGDLLVGVTGLSLVAPGRINILLECKDGDKKPSARKLTPAQVKFRREWKGQYDIVESLDEAIAVVQRERRRLLPPEPR